MIHGWPELRTLGSAPQQRSAVLICPMGISTSRLAVEKTGPYRHLPASELASLKRYLFFTEKAQPAAASVYELAQAGDHLTLTREYILGESLAALGPLPVAVTRAVALEVCRLVERLHASDPLGHGWLTPGNVFITFGGAIKVTGFGLGALRPEPPPRHEADFEALRLLAPGAVGRSVAELRQSLEVDQPIARPQLAQMMWLMQGERALADIHEVVRLVKSSDDFARLLSLLPETGSPAWEQRAVELEALDARLGGGRSRVRSGSYLSKATS